MQVQFLLRCLTVAGCLTLSGIVGSVEAQSAPVVRVPATAPSQAPAATEAPAASTPSGLMQSGIDALKQALTVVRLDKWKTSAAVRDEADANLGSIRRDVETTLPGLLAAADANPTAVTKTLPAYRNIEALYDVLLRVTTAARMSGPKEQSVALDQALSSLDSGRRTLAEHMQTMAVAQEKQIGDLRAALKTAQSAVPVAAAPACPAPTPPARKKKPAAKPAVKPAAPAN